MSSFLAEFPGTIATAALVSGPLSVLTPKNRVPTTSRSGPPEIAR
jgi:hypothetical protein